MLVATDVLAAAGLLLPFTRRAHLETLIAARPDVAILTEGFAPAAVRRIRAADIHVMYHTGSSGHTPGAALP
jgi:hypothetical protein